MRKNIYIFTLATGLVFSTACTQSERNRTEAAAERTGDKVEKAAERATDATERGLHRTGEALDNAGLTAKVKTMLAADVRLSTLTSINVDSRDGVVTLTGTVPTAEDKRLAENVVKNTEGVKRAINNLAVRP